MTDASVTAGPPASMLSKPVEVAFGGDVIRRYHFDNGLKVLLLQDASAPVVTYFTWYGVGSRHEKPGKTGLAHLFEHLMFNETSNLKAGEFDRILEENGAESNAATWVDWTYYYESLPADRLHLAIQLESDRMANLVLRDAQVSSEKEVVANERRYRVEDDVDGAASELLYKTAFKVHPYHWPTIGWMADIQGFTPQDCEAFYKTYYAPNNATVVIVGSFDEQATLELLHKAYGSLPRATIPEDVFQVEPPQTAERIVEIQKPTASDKVHIAYRAPALDHPDHVPLTVMNEILAGGRASRLHKALITDAEVASDFRGWLGTFRCPGLYEITVSARAEHSAAELETVVWKEVDALKARAPSAAEVERSVARLELALLQSLETMSGKAEQIGFYETVLGNPATAFARLEAYRKVTPEDVQRVARHYLVPEARTIVRVFPDGTESDEGAYDDMEDEGEG